MPRVQHLVARHKWPLIRACLTSRHFLPQMQDLKLNPHLVSSCGFQLEHAHNLQTLLRQPLLHFGIARLDLLHTSLQLLVTMAAASALQTLGNLKDLR